MRSATARFMIGVVIFTQNTHLDGYPVDSVRNSQVNIMNPSKLDLQMLRFRFVPMRAPRS